EAAGREAIEAAVLDALGLDAGDRARLPAALRERGPLLLVLDNFEQIVTAAPSTVSVWLAEAPEASLLVTSRQRLAVPGEEVFELGPLSIDEEASRSEAFALFVERARAVDHGFVVAPEAV